MNDPDERFTARAAGVGDEPAPRALSARELLSKLEGAERDELQRAMQARDLDTVRELLAKHSARASVAVQANAPGVSAPAPMMTLRGWTPKRVVRASGGRFKRGSGSGSPPPVPAA